MEYADNMAAFLQFRQFLDEKQSGQFVGVGKNPN